MWVGGGRGKSGSFARSLFLTKNIRKHAPARIPEGPEKSMYKVFIRVIAGIRLYLGFAPDPRIIPTIGIQ